MASRQYTAPLIPQPPRRHREKRRWDPLIRCPPCATGAIRPRLRRRNACPKPNHGFTRIDTYFPDENPGFLTFVVPLSPHFQPCIPVHPPSFPVHFLFSCHFPVFLLKWLFPRLHPYPSVPTLQAVGIRGWPPSLCPKQIHTVACAYRSANRSSTGSRA